MKDLIEQQKMLISIAEDILDFEREMAKKYSMDVSEIQDIIKQLLR